MYQCIIYQHVRLLIPYHAWPLRAADFRPCSSFHFALCDAWNPCPMMHNDPWHWRCLIDLLQNDIQIYTMIQDDLPNSGSVGFIRHLEKVSERVAPGVNQTGMLWHQHSPCMSLWIRCEHLPTKAPGQNRLAFLALQSCFRFPTLPDTRWSKAKLRLGQATTTSSTSHWWTCCNSIVEKIACKRPR